MISNDKAKWLVLSAWLRAKKMTKGAVRRCRKRTRRANKALETLGSPEATAVARRICRTCGGCIMSGKAPKREP